MLALLQDLVRHKGFANAAILRSTRNHAPAAQDNELRKLLHHVILADRYWLSLILTRPFHLEEESQVPAKLETVLNLFRDTHAAELEWISNAREPDLARTVETPFIPGRGFSVAEAIMQVSMHSQGHRAQCAMRLRQLGGNSIATDFILWLKERPEADWS